MIPNHEKLTTITVLYGWKIVPSGYTEEGVDTYILTADSFENHPLLGDGGEGFRSGWIRLIDLERGFAITKSGTRYALA